jgi:hypothetical protein
MLQHWRNIYQMGAGESKALGDCCGSRKTAIENGPSDGGGRGGGLLGGLSGGGGGGAVAERGKSAPGKLVISDAVFRGRFDDVKVRYQSEQNRPIQSIPIHSII